MNKRTPGAIKKGLECAEEILCPNKKTCPYYYNPTNTPCGILVQKDVLAYIEQLEAEKKQLQERICNQRRSLRRLYVTYKWGFLSVLRKAKMYNGAKLQVGLKGKGYDLTIIEFPELPKEEDK